MSSLSSISYKQAAQVPAEATVIPPLSVFSAINGTQILSSFSPISYKRAAQVAAGSIALALVPPVSIVAAIGAASLGTIGIFGIEYADKIRESYVGARDQRLHGMASWQGFSPADHQEALEKAVGRLRKEKSYEWIYSNSSIEEDYAKYQKELEEGCCHGAVSTLFHGIEKQRLSIEQSATALVAEEVFFRQIVHQLERGVDFLEKDVNEQIQTIKDARGIKRIKNFAQFLAGSLDVTCRAMEKGLKEFEGYETELTNLREKIKKYGEEKTHLKEEDPLLSPSFESRKFPPERSWHSYQQALEKALQSYPVDTTVRGTVNTPKHVMGFQYGPEGYYIYDSFSPTTGGLLKYSDKESFFKKMRTLVLQTIPFTKTLTREEINVFIQATYLSHA
ncbi:MAG: hypothetical protein WA347_08525 [Rhabdochlamydiaceae bacterium]|jgi:hypothetical protein